MQFIIIAYDGKDSEALARRMAVREAHIEVGNAARDRGEQLMACAMLDEKGNMCGSMIVVDFESREQLNTWLESEPYITGNVWQEIQIIPCKVGPSFSKK